MIPELTTEQRRENLEKAMAARSCRAEILKGVADGKCSVADVCPVAITEGFFGEDTERGAHGLGSTGVN